MNDLFANMMRKKLVATQKSEKVEPVKEQPKNEAAEKIKKFEKDETENQTEGKEPAAAEQPVEAAPVGKPNIDMNNLFSKLVKQNTMPIIAEDKNTGEEESIAK